MVISAQQKGPARQFSELPSMKICDVCQKPCSALRAGPAEAPDIETCEDCCQDSLRRFREIEQQLMKTRLELRIVAVQEWRRERGPAARG